MKNNRILKVVALALTISMCFGSFSFGAEMDGQNQMESSTGIEESTELNKDGIDNGMKQGGESETANINENQTDKEEQGEPEKTSLDSDVSQEELDEAILWKEREQRKKELGWATFFSADEERYAALFGAKYNELDTRGDVDASNRWLTKMKYITEPFKEPVFDDLNRRYYCSDIVAISGHGEPLLVKIGCDTDKKTDNNYIGVKAEGSASTDSHGMKFVGIGRKDLSYCKLMMFIACQTANGGGITKYAMDHGAKAVVGWTTDIDSAVTTTWLDSFYSSLSQGNTIEQARVAANTKVKMIAQQATNPIDKASFNSLANNVAYGTGKYNKLVYNPSTYVEEEDPFTYIQEPIKIDCETGDLEELIVYLEKNVAGFSRDTCDLTTLYQDGEGDEYAIGFNRMYQGFDTYYFISLYKRGNEIFYFSTLDQFKEPRIEVMQKEDIPEEVIEQAKKEAIAAANTKDRVESQKITFGLDNEYRPYIGVMTTFRDAEGEEGAFWATSYAYELVH